MYRRTASLGAPRRRTPMHNIGAVMADALLKGTSYTITPSTSLIVNESLFTLCKMREITRGHMNIRGPQLFYSFFHTLDESSSYWRTICGLELCFVVFVTGGVNTAC